MTDKEIEDFVNGKVAMVPKDGGGFTTEPLTEGGCGCCGKSEKEISVRFKVGDKVVYDEIRGSFGRHVGEGVIADPKEYGSNVDGCFMYLVDTGDYLRWYHHCQLTPFTGI